MIDLDAILLARAAEQIAAPGLPAGGADPWDVRNVKPPRRLSMKGRRCVCGKPAEKRSLCHRCYMRARRES